MAFQIGTLRGIYVLHHVEVIEDVGEACAIRLSSYTWCDTSLSCPKLVVKQGFPSMGASFSSCALSDVKAGQTFTIDKMKVRLRTRGLDQIYGTR